jgi:hypothetical protein
MADKPPLYRIPTRWKKTRDLLLIRTSRASCHRGD